MKTTTEPLKFTFKPIKLDEIAALIPETYRSKYEAIRQQVISAIENLPSDESFMMQVDRKQMEQTRTDPQNVRNGINEALVRQDIPWRVVFSEKLYAFVVVPKKQQTVRPRKTAEPRAPREPEALSMLLETTQKTFGCSLADLKQHYGGEELINIRRAFAYVGSRVLKIPMRAMASALGRKYPQAFRRSAIVAMEFPSSAQKVRILTDALKGDK